MTAEAAAVIPTIRLLVAVATRNGTPIPRCISGTLMMPPPTPSSAEMTPAPVAPTTPPPRWRTWYPGPDSSADHVWKPEADAGSAIDGAIEAEGVAAEAAGSAPSAAAGP